jgi:hypothetical protein
MDRQPLYQVLQVRVVVFGQREKRQFQRSLTIQSDIFMACVRRYLTRVLDFGHDW